MVEVAAIFILLVAVFVVYQQRNSGWTWREFVSGMLDLAGRGARLAIGLYTGHLNFGTSEENRKDEKLSLRRGRSNRDAQASPRREDSSNAGEVYRGSVSAKLGSDIKSLGSPYDASRPLGPLQWIEASQSPFGILVLDCRSIAHGTVSMARDLQVALKFTNLRNSNGEQHRGSVPSEPLHTDCSLTYPCFDKVGDGPLFVAQEMEDKWDIYLFEGNLYFARSWTGDLIFRAKIDFSGSGSRISSIDAKSGAVNKDTSLAIRQVDFLVKSHILKREVPHPVPADYPDDPDKIAIYSLQLYGRWASYATYEETIKIRIEGGQLSKW